jgi:cytochrome b6-f complex iron-sulfur subunit
MMSAGNNDNNETTLGNGSPPQEPQAAQSTISRRKALRRLGILTGGAVLVVTAEACGATLWALYKPQATQLGGQVIVGRKTDFPAAMPQACTLDTAGVFYRREVRGFVVHLSADTEMLLSGAALTDALSTGSILRDEDDSYWFVLHQTCPHLGAPLEYLLSCRSFKCPSHGAHFHCDGEYLDGPSPRSMDRFPVRFDGPSVVVDTGRLNQSVARPEVGNRLLPPPASSCSVG